MTPRESSSAYIPLPAGLENPRESARTTFDRSAAVYAAVRPNYPAEAIAELISRCDLGPASRVLEIGCGTGQATCDVATSGCAMRCLEPGPELARIARQNLTSCPNVEIVLSTFEEADEEPGSYHAVVSATAFHWVDPALGYPKAARLLRPDGALALLSNVHVGGGTQDQLSPDVQALHRRIAPEVGSWTFPSVEAIRGRAEGGGDIAAVWSRIERKFADAPVVGDLFEPPWVSTYPWLATYDADTYQAMLSTQSTYALMDPERRDELLRQVGHLVESNLGGTITKQYVAILAIARRSPDPGR